MRIQIASDLHLEFRNGRVPPRCDFAPVRDRDLLVLAGDIGRQRMARFFIERELAVSPVMYVPGNHEYYSRKSSRGAVDDAWRTISAQHEHLHYLVGEAIEIDGFRFWGGPWYSDLWGMRDRRTPESVRMSINDFSSLWGAWTVSQHIEAHYAQTDLLRQHAGRIDVVITHWPPTKEAMHAEADDLTPYYFNDQPDLVRQIGAKAWISGHTHEAYDYRIGPTRCVGNPAGYPDEKRTSNVFRPDRVIVV